MEVVAPTLADGGSSACMAEADRYNAWTYDLIAAELRPPILEIGCGIGNITRFLRRSGPVLATDISAEAVGTLRNRIDGVRARVADLSVAGTDLGERFGAVVMLNVLEHIADEATVLDRIRAHLEPGGRFVCLVPAHPWMFSRMDRAAGHYRRYSDPRFRRTLERNGFRVRRMIHFNPVGAVGWFFNKVFGGGQLNSAETTAQISLFDKFVPILRHVHMDGFPFCLSLIAIAEPA